MKLFKGWFGEKKAAVGMWMALDARKYLRIHDLIFPSGNGTTQIDHLVVSKYGLFIVETKNFQGWIFGDKGSARWTQVMGRKKYPFQNPLRQTYRQKKTLAALLSVSESHIFDVVYFVGECSFKTRMPTNVISSGLGRYIKRHKTVLFSESEVSRILKQLLEVKEGKITRKEHLSSLHERHGSSTTCPSCGGDLVRRMARKGRNAGRSFLGCENYPECRFTRNIE